MALYEQRQTRPKNGTQQSQGDGRAMDRARTDNGNRHSIDHRNRETVIDGQTMGGIIGISGNSNVAKTLMAFDHRRLRHSSALICPTLAENAHYGPAMFGNERAWTMNAGILPDMPGNLHAERLALNPKFMGSAIDFTKARGEGIGIASNRSQPRKVGPLRSVESGAKGEMAYHAVV